MSGVLFVLTWSRFQSEGEDVDLLPDGMMVPFRCYGSVWQDPWAVITRSNGMVGVISTFLGWRLQDKL